METQTESLTVKGSCGSGCLSLHGLVYTLITTNIMILRDHPQTKMNFFLMRFSLNLHHNGPPWLIHKALWLYSVSIHV